MHILKKASKYFLAPIAVLTLLAPQVSAAAETIKLVGTIGEVTLPPVPTLGNSWTSPTATLTGGANSSLTCQISKVTPPTFTSKCTWAVKFPSGDELRGEIPSLTLKGAGLFAPADVTITGGAGKYANARGSGTQEAVDLANKQLSVVLNVE